MYGSQYKIVTVLSFLLSSEETWALVMSLPRSPTGRVRMPAFGGLGALHSFVSYPAPDSVQGQDPDVQRGG